MGHAKIDFDPRNQLQDFLQSTNKISLIRRVSGKKHSKNMLILGENLSTLAALKTGSGISGQGLEVELIIIDPPYNVGGNQGYKNLWKGESDKQRDWARDHGEFLDFMEPRLKIGRSLLGDDGVIFVNICDAEYCYIKILMNEIFGEKNEIATFIWNKGRAAASSHAAASHEFILCYAKNKELAPKLQQVKPSAERMILKSKEFLSLYNFTEAQNEFKKWVYTEKKGNRLKSGEAAYSTIHPTNHRLFHADNSCAQDDPSGKRCRKILIHPETKKPCAVPKNGWKWSEKTLDNLVKNGKIWFGKDHKTIPKIIRYLDEKMNQLPLTVIFDGSDGKRDLPENVIFSTPKPVSLIKSIISLYPNKNCTVLDYFAGSGATAHAVHNLNKEDGGFRNWIMIEEMLSTFNDVLIPRIKSFDIFKDFTIYENKEVEVGTKMLADMFNKYSFDFLSVYHEINEDSAISLEGMNILGYEENLRQIVALITPCTRKLKHFFEEELFLLKDAIKRNKAKKVLIYTISKNIKFEEPWLGVDKTILHGTSCKQIEIFELPEKLIEEWNEFLVAMAA